MVRKQFLGPLFAGTKAYDLRIDRINPFAKYALLYEPEDQLVVGGFAISEVLTRPIPALWSKVGERATTKARFFDYFKGFRNGTAIGVGAIERFDPPIRLDEVRRARPGFMVPVSYAYLGIQDPILELVRHRSPIVAALNNGATQAPLDAFSQPGLRIGPATADDRPLFLRLAKEHIGASYDQIDDSFGESIWTSHESANDRVGYFTLRKRIHRIETGDPGVLAGFTVTTEKRGGSVKFGPTIILPEFRGQGIGRRARLKLDDEHAARGFRKAYATIPASKADVLRYLLACGYRIEAHLRRHYTADHDELVLGKVLRHESAKRATWVGPAKTSIPRFDTLRGADAAVGAYMRRRMEPDYGDIDEDFTDRVFQAIARYEPSDFTAKGKQVYAARDDGDVVGAAICTPKRGGSVKVAPFLFDGDDVQGAEFLRFIEHQVMQLQAVRRFYSFLPPHEQNALGAARLAGYETEGILREPYRAGVDMIVVGRNLEVQP